MSQEFSIAAHRELETTVQVAAHQVSQARCSPITLDLGLAVDHDRYFAVAGTCGATVERDDGVTLFARLCCPNRLWWTLWGSSCQKAVHHDELVASAAKAPMRCMEIKADRSTRHVRAINLDLQDHAMGAQHKMLPGIRVDQNVLKSG